MPMNIYESIHEASFSAVCASLLIYFQFELTSEHARLTAGRSKRLHFEYLKSSFLTSNGVSTLALRQGQQQLPQEGLQLQQS